MSIDNRLSAIRRSRGLSAAELAARVAVSRQTIYSIEAGSYVPNTVVALQLARVLDVSVEDLFSLADVRESPSESLPVMVLSPARVRQGRPVRLCRVGESWVGVPATTSPYFLPEADAVVTRGRGGRTGSANVQVFGPLDPSRKRLLIGGCDPAIGLLARLVEQLTGVEVIAAPAASRLALGWLKAGNIHVAGTHLQDDASGEWNLPYLRQHFAGEDLTVVTFAGWQEGFVVAPGNVRKIRSAGDLTSPGVRFINREPGSGSRRLVDKLLREEGLSPTSIAGYDRVAFGHLPAAWHIAAGDADCCVAPPSAARAFGLDFVPIRQERFDLVMRTSTLDLPAARGLMDVLNRAVLRRKLEALAGYDTSRTGSIVAG